MMKQFNLRVSHMKGLMVILLAKKARGVSASQLITQKLDVDFGHESSTLHLPLLRTRTCNSDQNYGTIHKFDLPEIPLHFHGLTVLSWLTRGLYSESFETFRKIVTHPFLWKIKEMCFDRLTRDHTRTRLLIQMWFNYWQPHVQKMSKDPMAHGMLRVIFRSIKSVRQFGCGKIWLQLEFIIF